MLDNLKNVHHSGHLALFIKHGHLHPHLHAILDLFIKHLHT